MLRLSGQLRFIAASVFFILLLAACLVYDAHGTLGGLMLLAFLLAGFLLSFFDLSIPFRLLVFLIPLSVKLLAGNGTTIITPSEPLTGLLAIAFCCSFITRKPAIDKAFLYHPITLFIAAYLFFLAVSAVFSGLTIVSLKALIVRTAYILVFYGCGYTIVSRNIRGAGSLYLLYAAALLPVILITLYHHSIYGFSKDTSNTAPLPFYNDHTIYSACIAFVIPALFFYLIYSRQMKLGGFGAILIAALLALLCVAVFFSYCRAAWLSLVAGIVFCLILFFRIRIRWLLSFFALAGILLFVYRDNILLGIKRNRNDSNAKNANLVQQTKSVTNVTNDQSNAERLNRWVCALRMFRHRPYAGFGLGTYQFEYLRHQRQKEMTSLSVTSPYNIKPGRGGSAHSEYLLTLSESGIFALICFAAIVLGAIYTGMRTFLGRADAGLRIISVMAATGLTTYAVHGLFNNFLDVDKAAFLFWSSLSVITAASIRAKGAAKNEQSGAGA